MVGKEIMLTQKSFGTTALLPVFSFLFTPTVTLLKRKQTLYAALAGLRCRVAQREEKHTPNR
jgi:hypothetical protein